MASSPPMARSGRPTESLRGRCSCQTGFAPPWRCVAAAMVLCGPCVCSSYKHPPNLTLKYNRRVNPHLVLSELWLVCFPLVRCSSGMPTFWSGCSPQRTLGLPTCLCVPVFV